MVRSPASGRAARIAGPRAPRRGRRPRAAVLTPCSSGCHSAATFLAASRESVIWISGYGFRARELKLASRKDGTRHIATSYSPEASSVLQLRVDGFGSGFRPRGCKLGEVALQL